MVVTETERSFGGERKKTPNEIQPKLGREYEKVVKERENK